MLLAMWTTRRQFMASSALAAAALGANDQIRGWTDRLRRARPFEPGAMPNEPIVLHRSHL